MDYLKLADFRQLKAFFLALKQGQFITDSRQTSAIVTIEGIRTPVDKKRCLKLLRSFPDFQGDQFNDDVFLIRYLSNPNNLQRVLGRFTIEQQLDLKKVLEAPVAAEEVGQPPVPGEVPAEQAAPVGTTGSTPMGGIASAPAIPFGRGRVISNIPHAPEPPKPEISIANSSGIVVKGPGAETPDPSKLVKASSSGVVAEAPPSKILIANKSGIDVGEHAVPKATAPKIPYSVKKAAKDAGSSANIFIKKGGNRLMGGLSSMLGGAGRAGGGMLGGAIGGGGRVLGNFGLKAADVMANLSRQVSTGSLIKAPSKRFGMGILISFLLLAAGISVIASLTQTQQPTQPAQPIAGTSDISSCKFTRENQQIYPVKSARLRSIMQEAAATTGVPAAILASVAMHESPSFVPSAEDSHGAFGTENTTSEVGCTSFGLTSLGLGTSSTGALGLMQVQPPKIIHDAIYQALSAKGGQQIPTFESVGAYSTDGVATGAKFLNKTVDQLTLQDFCDVRASVYLGAGVLIAKNGGKSPATADEVAKSVCGYFGGSCTYGGRDEYDYGLEAKSDFEQCKSTSLATIANASCPIPDGKISCGSYEGVSGKITPCHCTDTYPPRVAGSLCTTLFEGGNLVRTGKAIDVMPAGRRGVPGDQVFLPSIEGQPVNWHFVKSDIDKQGYGGLRLFKSDPTPKGTWYLYLIHVNTVNPAVDVTKVYNSGDEAAWIGPGFDHVHVNIGLDIKDFGEADYFDPGWRFPDKDLGMCTGVITPGLAATTVSEFTIGSGSKGTPIKGYKLGDGPTGVAIIGSIHGKWEDAARQLVEAAKESLANGSIKAAANLSVYFIPLINVDPLSNNQNDGRSAFNTNSVDLNRNFDTTTVPNGRWNKFTCARGKYQDLGASPYSCEGIVGTEDASAIFPEFCNDRRRTKQQVFYCAEGYSGSGPLSEPESQALANFLKGNNIRVVLSYHAPLSDVTISNGGSRVDGAVELARLIANTTNLIYHDFFPVYPVTGQLMDWLQDQGIIGVEVELPPPAGGLDSNIKSIQLNGINKALEWTAGKFK